MSWVVYEIFGILTHFHSMNYPGERVVSPPPRKNKNLSGKGGGTSQKRRHKKTCGEFMEIRVKWFGSVFYWKLRESVELFYLTASLPTSFTTHSFFTKLRRFTSLFFLISSYFCFTLVVRNVKSLKKKHTRLYKPAAGGKNFGGKTKVYHPWRGENISLRGEYN